MSIRACSKRQAPKKGDFYYANNFQLFSESLVAENLRYIATEEFLISRDKRGTACARETRLEIARIRG